MVITFYPFSILLLIQKDKVNLGNRVTAFMDSYFDVIFALNEVTHPGEKRLVQKCKEQCEILPNNFERNIEKLFEDLYVNPKMIEADISEIIKELEKFDNYSLSTLSQTDIISIKKAKPPKKVGLYKYKGTYGKKEEQTTLLSESLYNSFNRKNSRELTGVSETLNESSSQVFEFISDGISSSLFI